MTTTSITSTDDLRRRFRGAATRRALDELRHDVAQAIRQVADDTTDDGGLSDEAQSLFDALKQLLTEIDGKISRQAVVDDLNVRTARRDRADQSFDRSLHEFSLRGMILSAIGSPLAGLDLGRSMEISQEIRARSGRRFMGIAVPIEALSLRGDYARKLETRATISTDLPVGGPGGNLIATILDATRYVDALRARTVVRQAGAQVIGQVVGNLDIPRMKKFGQVSWFQEGEDIADTDQEFDRVNFRPKHCGAISVYSRNMLLQSTPDIEMVLRDDLSRLLALDLDRVALCGSGQGAEPLGVVRNSLVTKIAPTGFEYLNNVELRRQLNSKNVPLETIGFVGNSQIDAWSLSALDAMSRPLGKALVYAGYPDYTSNVATAAAVGGGTPLPAVVNPLIIGAWSDLILTFWAELDILPNATADSVYRKGAVAIRAIMTADVNVRHPESFAWQDVTEGPALPPFIQQPNAPRTR